MFNCEPVILRRVLHADAVVDMLEFQMLNTVYMGFEDMNRTFGGDNQTVGQFGKLQQRLPLVIIRFGEHCMQINQRR